MNEKMRAIKKKMEAALDAAASAEDIAEKSAKMDEFDTLQKEFDTEKRVYEAEKSIVAEKEPIDAEKASGGSATVKNDYDSAVKSMAAAARKGFNGLTEGVDADGGYTVPREIETKINTLIEREFRLRPFVRYSKVETMAGRKTFRKRATGVAFKEILETGTVQEAAYPEYFPIEWVIKKYGGYMTATSELLEDSDASIVGEISEWLARESVATENANIKKILDAKSKVDFADIDGIKKTVITTLGAAFPSMRILTNDTGILYLDTLKDADGNYLLKQDPTQPATFRLRCGTRTLEVTNAPDFLIPNGEGGKVPFIVGDLNEGIEFFDRKMMSVKGSDVASVENFNAFANDGMIYRALLRHDVRQRDEDSFVSGYITVAAG